MTAERRTVVKGHLIIVTSFIGLVLIGVLIRTGVVVDIIGALSLLSFPAAGLWSALGNKKEAGFSIGFGVLLWAALQVLEFLRFYFFEEDPYGWDTAGHIVIFFIIPAVIGLFFLLGVWYGWWWERRASGKVGRS
ncbi:MAG TPA: hypothetical protein VFO76_07300 [Candidatus Kapabacteria bacterium]|nr:hypothetical protein [Candidatus Kapabacteria bacterium]